MHTILQPDDWAAPRGYSNGMAASGRLLFVSGQVGWNAQGVFETDDLVAQLRQALENVVAVLATAGARPETPVDKGSELTWIARSVLEALGILPQRKQGFIVADGRRIERDIGYALVHAGGTEAPDLVVFAEPGDMVLLGAHSLEGLNLKIDPVRKQLVPAGPVITAAAA